MDFKSIDYIKKRINANNDLSAGHGQILLNEIDRLQKVLENKCAESSDFPSYEELEAQLWVVEHERDKYREALERIADMDEFDPASACIAQQTLEGTK